MKYLFWITYILYASKIGICQYCFEKVFQYKLIKCIRLQLLLIYVHCDVFFVFFEHYDVCSNCQLRRILAITAFWYFIWILKYSPFPSEMYFQIQWCIHFSLSWVCYHRVWVSNWVLFFRLVNMFAWYVCFFTTTMWLYQDT